MRHVGLLFNNKHPAVEPCAVLHFAINIAAMSNLYDKDGKMAEANKLLDEAKTFLYIGKVREARKIWDREPNKDDAAYHETFWKKAYEDCYKEGYLKTSWWKRVLGKFSSK